MGSLKIALAVYQDILNDHNWDFPTELSQNVLEKLTVIQLGKPTALPGDCNRFDLCGSRGES